MVTHKEKRRQEQQLRDRKRLRRDKIVMIGIMIFAVATLIWNHLR
jgi:hypothetical protein